MNTNLPFHASHEFFEIVHKHTNTYLERTTHLNFFMNAPEKSPVVEDALITYRKGGETIEDGAYGPYNVKILKNFRGDAWYAGQNADTFAWYAMAIWAKKELGHYPPLPRAGSTKPKKPPRRGDGSSFNRAEEHPEESSDLVDEEIPDQSVEGFSIPGCGDKFDVDDKVIPVLNVSCVPNASVIPSTVFSSDDNRIYNIFCGATINNHNQLHWMANIYGNPTGNSPPKSKAKRESRVRVKRNNSPGEFLDWEFKLDWEPTVPFNPDDCFLDCSAAFAILAAPSECSQMGDSKDLMSMSGQVDVGCGIYGYMVVGISSPPPPPSPPAPPAPPPKSKALSIILQNYIYEAANENSWLFFTTSIGVSVLCHSDKDAISKAKTADDPSLVENPPWPGGIFPLKLDGMDCDYKNDGTNPGALWCNNGGDNKVIACQQDDLRWSGKENECETGLWHISQHPVVFCEW